MRILSYLKNPIYMLLALDKARILRLPDKLYLKLFYRKLQNKKLDLRNPKTLNEKLQWLKLYDRKKLYTTMSDKYEAKKYVANVIGEEYIIETLGVWNSFDEIDFNKLPNQFVLKCTHDSGGLVICKDKNKFDYKAAKNKINKSLKNNYYYMGREWPYKDIKPRIIAEKYMKDENQKEDLIDYKFFCFNGEPKFIYVSEGLSNHETAKISFADMEYKKVEFYRKDYRTFDILPPKPENFEKMKKLAEELSKDIPFLRVDFYEINHRIYFGELTFFPCSGVIPFEPPKYDKILGELLELPKKQNN